MKKAILVFGLMLALCSISFGQEAEKKNEGKVILKAGTEFSARLQTDVNAQKAKVPMDIMLKTTEGVEGIEKNTEVYARIVRAEKISKENDTSKIGVLFDFVKKDGKFLPLDASVIGLDKSTDNIEFSESPTFEGGTVLSLKSKDINLAEGTIVRIKLKENLTEN
jgi:hypothetical protein